LNAHGQNLIYESGQWQVHLGRRELRSSGVAVPIGARAFEIIEVLVRSANELVTKNDLMDRIWPGAMVGENTLQVHISAIRKALGSDRAMLKTASGRGYRLLGSWTPQHQGSPIPPAASPPAASPPAASPPARGPGAPPANNLPLIGRLIGRAAAARHVRDLVSAYRVVTLTGPGGIGKTSLVLEAAHGLLADFGGAWFVELGSLPNPDLVPSTVASALGLKLSGEISAESVARAVGAKHALLVLDNCEHVIDAAANLVEYITRLCPHATTLLTSREVLRVDGEAVYRVPPLDVPAPGPETPDHLLGHSAVELFIARLNALDAGFSPSGDDLTAVAAICRHLDGIPLAIEFAAASAATLGIASVAVGLRDRFALLTRGHRTALARQRTLRATLDWSHELLPEAEQQLFRRLAVFHGGFTLDAAAAVVADTGLDAAAVMYGVANLVAKSLVVVGGIEGATRWHLLETIKAYAAEKLVKHDELETVARHQAWYFRNLFTHRESDSNVRLLDDDWTRRVREIDNVRAALDWSFSPRGDSAVGIDLTVAYTPVWLNLSLTGEYRDRCERALRELEGSPAPDVRVRMWLQIDLGISLFDTMGGAAQARDLLTRALEVAESLGDLDGQARVLSSLVTNYIFQAEQGKGRAAAERLGQVARQIGDPAIIRLADRLMGIALVMLGRPREGQQFLERVLAAPRPTADQRRQLWYPQEHPASARAFLARALWLQGFTDRAYREAQASLDELKPTDHQLLLCRVLYFGMCRVAPSTGNFAAAEQSIARLIEAATTLNAPFWQTAGRFLMGKLMVERGQFAQGVATLRDAFEACRRTGWRMSYPEFMGTLATGLAALGAPGDALEAVNDGLAGASQGEDGSDLYLADLLRIKGDVLLQHGAVTAAEESFLEAIAIARQQDALLWEIRAALSLARSRATQGRANEARQLLTSVYDRFAEGFETPDLRAARAFLDELSRDGLGRNAGRV
jgi:predicted ATPase/DNA-binding winged helix-turn-helix (wHTH) protein